MGKNYYIDFQEKMEEKSYCNLVLEGGGVLSVAYAGALQELENKGILKGIINYAGASAGAMVAGGLACGANSEYITKMMKSSDFKKFADYGSKIKVLYNIYRHNGACPGNYFSEWYGSIIEELTGDRNITLKQLHDRKGGKLVIAVVNVTTRRPELWDYKNKPDVSLVEAVRASMSMIVIFEPAEIDGNLYIDGGTLCNYPIQAFHYDGEDGDTINPRTLGLMLMSNSELRTRYPKIESFFQYITASIECVRIQTQKMHLDEQDWKRTIKIPTGNVSSINFGIGDQDKNTLIEAGKKAVLDHFSGIKTFTTTAGFKSGHTKKEEN